MEFNPEPLDPSEVQAINAQASILMKQGIRLLADPRPAAVAEALVCFDQALELRSGLPMDEAPLLRYGLAACWLNRADALIRLGGAGQIAAALRASDEGIVLLCSLPLKDDPRFSRRLAMAYQNRGLALQTQGSVAGTDALAAFTDAIAVLSHDHATPIPDRQYLLAVVWTNLANTRASEANAESDSLARDAAITATTLVAELEADDADAAEVGLKARHVLCRTFATRLSLPAAPDETMPDDVHEATDIVDDGLDLARRWEKKGISRFRDVACDLFRFGARVYARYQPHFLSEFVRDNMDPGQSSPDYVESPEMSSAAREALGLTNRSGS